MDLKAILQYTGNTYHFLSFWSLHFGLILSCLLDMLKYPFLLLLHQFSCTQLVCFGANFVHSLQFFIGVRKISFIIRMVPQKCWWFSAGSYFAQQNFGNNNRLFRGYRFFSSACLVTSVERSVSTLWRPSPSVQISGLPHRNMVPQVVIPVNALWIMITYIIIRYFSRAITSKPIAQVTSSNQSISVKWYELTYF